MLVNKLIVISSFLAMKIVVFISLIALTTSTYARPLDEILESGEIRFCVVVWGPMVGKVNPSDCLGNECTFEGPVKNLSLAFAEFLDPQLEPSFRVLKWDQQFHNEDGVTLRDESYTPALMSSGTCDLYTSFMAERAWRQKKLAMPAVWPGRYVIVIHKDRAEEFGDLSSLAGTVGAVIENSTQHTALDQMNSTDFSGNPTQYSFVQNYGEGIDAVEGGEVDYTVIGADSALWYGRNEAKNSVAVFPIGPERMNNWALHKDYTELLGKVTEFIEIQQVSKGSALDQLFKDYTGLSYAKYLRLISHGIR